MRQYTVLRVQENHIENRGIVQLVEYRSPKPQVVGSNPTAPVIKASKYYLLAFCVLVFYGLLFLDGGF